MTGLGDDDRELIRGLLAATDFQLQPLHVGQSAPTQAQAEQTLSSVLLKDRALFLEKWGPQMSEEQLHQFDRFADDYEVGFHLKRLRRHAARQARASAAAAPPSTASLKATRNRRFNFMSRNEREPELYEEFMDRYAVEADKRRPFPDSMGLVDRIYYNLDNARYLQQDGEAAASGGGPSVDRADQLQAARAQTWHRRDEEEEQIVEYDTESESDARTTRTAEDGEEDDALEMEELEFDDQPTQQELDVREHDLHRMLQERFLDGNDPFVNYGDIDNNSEYDNLSMIGADVQDRYFDDDDDEDQDCIAEPRPMIAGDEDELDY
ncbi:hypothetical protein BC831DRAFT_436911 [Entophlyctis helioformis]|nr:hypothetical protein BC831DRAFT_436911 [Entophlyctis helioformis]